MWLIGKTIVHKGKTYCIKPFYLMKGIDLPSKKLVLYEMDTKWKPIFRLMMKAPDVPTAIPIPSDAGEDFVKETFDKATQYLKETVSYIIWKKGEPTYTIGTWSKKVEPSQVRMHGTESDIAKLGSVTCNCMQQKT